VLVAGVALAAVKITGLWHIPPGVW